MDNKEYNIADSLPEIVLKSKQKILELQANLAKLVNDYNAIVNDLAGTKRLPVDITDTAIEALKDIDIYKQLTDYRIYVVEENILAIKAKGSYRGTFADITDLGVNIPNPIDGDIVYIGTKNPYEEWVYNAGFWNKSTGTPAPIINLNNYYTRQELDAYLNTKKMQGGNGDMYSLAVLNDSGMPRYTGATVEYVQEQDNKIKDATIPNDLGVAQQEQQLIGYGIDGKLMTFSKDIFTKSELTVEFPNVKDTLKIIGTHDSQDRTHINAPYFIWPTHVQDYNTQCSFNYVISNQAKNEIIITFYKSQSLPLSQSVYGFNITKDTIGPFKLMPPDGSTSINYSGAILPIEKGVLK